MKTPGFHDILQVVSPGLGITMSQLLHLRSQGVELFGHAAALVPRRYIRGPY